MNKTVTTVKLIASHLCLRVGNITEIFQSPSALVKCWGPRGVGAFLASSYKGWAIASDFLYSGVGRRHRMQTEQASGCWCQCIPHLCVTLGHLLGPPKAARFEWSPATGSGLPSKMLYTWALWVNRSHNAWYALRYWCCWLEPLVRCSRWWGL